ncbi:MAG: hypothetical protein DRJ97_05830, partial [Thermoprotei archaeon]
MKKELTLVFLVALMLMVSCSFTVKAEWWDPSWSRRVEVLVENPGPPLRDYQVLVELPTRTGGSVRPVMEGELLSYWAESENKVWVKVPFIPSGSTVKFYVYFDNLEAEDLSDGAKVFDLFEDFESASLQGWTSTGGNWTVHDGKLAGSSLKLRECWDVLYTAKVLEDSVIEWYGRFKGSYAGVALVTEGGSFYYIIARIPFYGDFAYGAYRAGSNVELGSAGRADEDLHLYRMIASKGSIALYVDGVKQLSFNVTRAVGRFGFVVWDGVDSQVEVYWVRARRFVEPAPRVKVGMVESHRPTITSLTAESPALVGRGFWVNVTLWDPADDLEGVRMVISGLRQPIIASWSYEEGFSLEPLNLASLVDAELVNLGLGRTLLCFKLSISWSA